MSHERNTIAKWPFHFKMVLITSVVEADNVLKISFPENSGCETFFIPLTPTEETLKAWNM